MGGGERHFRLANGRERYPDRVKVMDDRELRHGWELRTRRTSKRKGG